MIGTRIHSEPVGGTMPRLLDSKARLLAHAADSLRLKLREAGRTIDRLVVSGDLPTVTAEKVVTEFFVDPDGAVQLPKTVSASNEELGWAAATAVKRWIFETPIKAGRAVHARHQLLFDFQ